MLITKIQMLTLRSGMSQDCAGGLGLGCINSMKYRTWGRLQKQQQLIAGRSSLNSVAFVRFASRMHRGLSKKLAEFDTLACDS